MVNTKIRLIIFFAAKGGEALYSQRKKRPGADYGSNNELLIAKFRLKLKKIGKTTRPFRYDLNQILKLPCNPAIPLLGIYPEKTIQKDTCIPMFIAAIFTIART